jgi:hypothetical protein
MSFLIAAKHPRNKKLPNLRTLGREEAAGSCFGRRGKPSSRWCELTPASLEVGFRGGSTDSKKTRNEGRTHDVVDNKGPTFGTHDVDENKWLNPSLPISS